MSINRQWHLTHKLPRNAKLEERLQWHIRHAANCSCRDMPQSIRRELEARGYGITPRSLK